MFLLTLGNRKWILLYIILRDLVIILVDQMAQLPLYVEQIVQGEIVFNSPNLKRETVTWCG